MNPDEGWLWKWYITEIGKKRNKISKLNKLKNAVRRQQ